MPWIHCRLPRYERDLILIISRDVTGMRNSCIRCWSLWAGEWGMIWRLVCLRLVMQSIGRQRLCNPHFQHHVWLRGNTVRHYLDIELKDINLTLPSDFTFSIWHLTQSELEDERPYFDVRLDWVGQVVAVSDTECDQDHCCFADLNVGPSAVSEVLCSCRYCIDF